jgi:hypothetical protein
MQEGCCTCVFLMKKLFAKISTCWEDSIFNTSCDLWILTTSFQTLSAVRHADSSAKFAWASRQAAHRSPSTQVSKKKKRHCITLHSWYKSMRQYIFLQFCWVDIKHTKGKVNYCKVISYFIQHKLCNEHGKHTFTLDVSKIFFHFILCCMCLELLP